MPILSSKPPEKSVCRALWKNPPAHVANSLASLCNYYNTRDITIAKVESEWLDKILKQKDANRE